MGKWIILGAAAMDTVVRVARHPQKDEIVFPSDIQYLPGGSAANVAVGLARLGEAASFFGTCGDDDAGRLIRESFLTEGVDVSGLKVKTGSRSGGAFVAVDDTGERVIYSLGGDALYTDPAELDRSAFDGLTGLYLSEVFTDVALTAADLARAQGAKVYFGPGGIMCSYGLDELAPVIAVCDCLLVNKPEALTLSGCGDKEAAIRRLLKAGAKAVVLTEGKAGAGWYTADAAGQILSVFVPAFSVPVVDTTGAGDTFTAGFLKASALDLPPKEALAFAAACAAKAVQSVGARSSMPTLADMAESVNWDRSV